MFELMTLTKPCDYWAAAFVVLAALFFLPNRFFDTSKHRKVAIISVCLVACLLGIQQKTSWAMGLLAATGVVLFVYLLVFLTHLAGDPPYEQDKL